jgi:hypothetical protein
LQSLPTILTNSIWNLSPYDVLFFVFFSFSIIFFCVQYREMGKGYIYIYIYMRSLKKFVNTLTLLIQNQKKRLRRSFVRTTFVIILDCLVMPHASCRIATSIPIADSPRKTASYSSPAHTFYNQPIHLPTQKQSRKQSTLNPNRETFFS